MSLSIYRREAPAPGCVAVRGLTISLLLIAAALGEYSEWEATFKPRPSLALVCAPAVAGLRREAAVGAVRSMFIGVARNARNVKRGIIRPLVKDQ